MKEDADIDELIMGTGESVAIAIKSANDDVIDAEIVGSSDEIIFDGDEDIIKPLFAAQEINTISRFSRSFSIINYILFGVSSPK